MTGDRFAGEYRRRVIDDELDDLFPHLPAILIDGPKGVGKTSTAIQRCSSIRRLDEEAEARIVRADPKVIGRDETPLLIDEWQRVPGIFDVVRRLVDADPVGGRFLLTGSAPTVQTHSGAGRITTLRMRPLTLSERGVVVPTVSTAGLLAGTAIVQGRTGFGLSDYVEEILAGGYPAMRGMDARSRLRQLDGYLDRIVDHDLAEAGLVVRRPATVMAWLRSYAAAIATTASWEKIRNAATSGISDKPAKSTTLPYIELLTALRILDPVPAWVPSNNHLQALTQQPKHHLADPALAARLVRRSATQLLQGNEPNPVVARDGGFWAVLSSRLPPSRCVRSRNDATPRCPICAPMAGDTKSTSSSNRTPALSASRPNSPVPSTTQTSDTSCGYASRSATSASTSSFSTPDRRHTAAQTESPWYHSRYSDHDSFNRTKWMPSWVGPVRRRLRRCRSGLVRPMCSGWQRTTPGSHRWP